MAVNQIKGGAALSYISLLLGNLIAILYTPFMLRVLGQSEYGIYSICNTVSSTIAMMDAGLAVAAVRYFSRDLKARELPSIVGTFFIFYLVLGLISFGILLIISNNAVALFSDSMSSAEIHSVRVILLITGVYLLVSFMTSVFNAYVVANERFVFIKTLDIIKSLLLPMLIIPFLLNGYKAIAMSTVTVCVFLLINIIKTIYSFSKLKIKISFRNINPLFIKEALPFAFIVLAKLICERLYWNGGQFMLGVVSGTVAVAVFSLAIQMRGYYEGISAILNNLFLPRFSMLSVEKNSIHSSSTLFLKICRIQTLIMGIVICGYFLFGKLFIILWAGADYTSSFYCSILIMIPCSIPFIQGSANAILQAQGKVRFQMIVYLLASIFIITGAYFIGGRFGAEGLSCVFVIAISFFEIVIMNVYYARLGINIKQFWTDFIHIMLAYIVLTALFFVVLHYVDLEDWLGLFWGILVFSLFAGMTAYYFAMNSDEKIMIKTSLKVLKEF